MVQRIDDLQLIFGRCTENTNVYFQPPSSVKMEYPCIVYSLDNIDTQFGDNQPYQLTHRYQVTVIGADPDSKIIDRVAALPMCTYQRHFTADNLNHDVFNMYF